MRLPRLRFTVRRLMALVAVLALILGVSITAVRLKRQRDAYLKLAAEHEVQETMHRNMEQFSLQMAQLDESSRADGESFQTQIDARGRGRPNVLSPALRQLKGRSDRLWADVARQNRESIEQNRIEAAMSHKTATHHAALKQKYLAAAARPWRSIEPDPPPPDLLGQAFYWSEHGEYRRAIAANEQLLLRILDDETVPNNLAWLLATCPDASLRDGKRAVELATTACRSTQWTEPGYIDTLAAAYAEAGDFAQAVAMQNKAIANVPADDPNLPGFRRRLQLYQNKTPYRDRAKSGT